MCPYIYAVKFIDRFPSQRASNVERVSTPFILSRQMALPERDQGSVVGEDRTHTAREVLLAQVVVGDVQGRETLVALGHFADALLKHDDVIKWKHFRVTGPLCGEFTGHRRILLTKASSAELWCNFFDLQLNKRLSKQSRRRWLETPSRWLWRHCNERNIVYEKRLSRDPWLHYYASVQRIHQIRCKVA